MFVNFSRGALVDRQTQPHDVNHAAEVGHSQVPAIRGDGNAGDRVGQTPLAPLLSRDRIPEDDAALVARSHADPDDTARVAVEVLESDTDLAAASVTIAVESGLVTARVTGRAPGMIRGTSAGVDVVEAVPLEGFRP